jgi:hypothetical protein
MFQHSPRTNNLGVVVRDLETVDLAHANFPRAISSATLDAAIRARPR